MYIVSHNILLAGYWNNYIEQLEYDEIKKRIQSYFKNKNEKI